MDKPSRYVKVPALFVEGEIIPYNKLKFEEDKDSICDCYVYGDDNRCSLPLMMTTYDLVSKKFVNPLSIDVKKETELKIGKAYFIESSINYRRLKRAVLTDIKYIDYNSAFCFYKELPDKYENLINDDDRKTLTKNTLIEIKHFSPTYIFDSGDELKTEYKIYEEET